MEGLGLRRNGQGRHQLSPASQGPESFWGTIDSLKLFECILSVFSGHNPLEHQYNTPHDT